MRRPSIGNAQSVMGGDGEFEKSQSEPMQAGTVHVRLRVLHRGRPCRG